MTYEQIVELWKKGYSRKYLYVLEYHHLKSSGRFNNLTAKEIRYMARRNVENVILTEYNSRLKPWLYKINLAPIAISRRKKVFYGKRKQRTNSSRRK